MLRYYTMLLGFAALFSLASCTSKSEADAKAKNSPSPADAAQTQTEVHGTEVKEVALTNPLNADWVKTGKDIYELKCSACHKLTADKLIRDALRVL